MKRTIFIIVGIVLLLAAIGYMAKDLFMPSRSPLVVADAVDSLKAGDAPVLYRPLFSFSPSMERITGIVCGDNDHLYISGKDKIEIYDYRGKIIGEFAISGTPGCLTVDRTGNVYAAMSDQILVLDPSGKVINRLNNIDTSSIVTSLAVRENNVYIADAGLKAVYVMDEKGKIKRRVGDADPQKGIESFIIPSPFFDLYPDKEGNLWVANAGRHKLEKFDNNGNLLSQWGIAAMTPDGFCGCCNPSNFTVLSDGSFITSEKGIPRVKIYDGEGKFLGMVAETGEFNEGTTGIDIAADSNDRIYVLDPVKKKITVYVRS